MSELRSMSDLFGTPTASSSAASSAMNSVSDAATLLSPSFSSASSASSASSSWWPPSWTTIVVVVLVLALLGINVFVLLARGTQDVAALLRPLLQWLGLATVATTQQVVRTSAAGAKAGVDVVADAAVDAVDALPGGTAASTNTDALKQALRDASAQAGGGGGGGDPAPDDTTSAIQSSGKAGWCFVGEERGVRSCARVGVNDTCMSGDIFPTRDVCVNPSLRA